jgi:hypothetical protein
VAKRSGLGMQLYVDGFDISGDIGSFQKISGGNTPLEVTDITQLAVSRIGGVRDGGVDFTAWNNTAANQEHAVLSTLPTTDRHLMGLLSTTLGDDGFGFVCKQLNYDWTRGADGSLTEQVSAVANGDGLEWGNTLTAGKRTDTTATAPATGVDLNLYGGASTAFGWTCYLQVFGITGTSATVTIQDSADNASFANLTGGAFTASTGVDKQRLQGGATATVRRYLKVNTTGTFSSAIFAVLFVRNTTATVF